MVMAKSPNTTPIPAKMKIKKIMSKLIKPETPTPQNLNTYNISFIDQFMGPLNFAVVLFYESKPENTIGLQESLARILVQFYPLAGRYIKNDHLVDCSDQGVEFVETEALDVDLAEVVAKTDTGQLSALLPEPYFRGDEGPDAPILSVQATSFPSGGLAVAIAVSHRVFDASSLCTFVAAWSAATNQDRTDEIIAPTFDIPSLLPYRDLGQGRMAASTQFFSNRDNELAVKRFWFKKSAIASLRSKISLENTRETVSRVCLVCAVVAEALIRLDRAKHGRRRDFIISQPIDMRERTIPPQPKHACGNFFLSLLTRRVAATDNNVGVHQLVNLIGDAVQKRIADYAELLSPNGDGDGRDFITNLTKNYVGEVSNPETNVIVFSDWSKFGFYEADFGWGKPVLTSVGLQRIPPMFSNTVTLMSDIDGVGIEAWVLLNRNDMRWFEQDEEIRFLTT